MGRAPSRRGRWHPLALLLGAIAAMVLVPSDAEAAGVPMKLDRSFGVDGWAITDIAGIGWEDEPFSLARQPDGKLLTPGKAFNAATGDFDFVVMRYTPDGALDPSFGDGGIVLTDIAGTYDEALGLAVQPDGRLVVGGFARYSETQADFAFVRYEADGSIDTSFGTRGDGRVIIDFFGGDDRVLGLALQSDGKIIGGGFATREATGLDFALVRLNPDGTLDTTHGLGGYVTTDYFGSTDAIYRLAIQPNDRVVAVGTTFNSLTGNVDFAFGRYLTSGLLDSDFATYGRPGIGSFDFFGETDYALAVHVQEDGKILAGGLAFNPSSGSNDFALVRFTADGRPDTGFGDPETPGAVTMNFFGVYDQILGIGIQPDDKIVVAGHAKHPSRHFDFALARFTRHGKPDETFGIAGRLTMDFFGGPDGIHGLVLLDDGTAVVAGDTLNPQTEGDDFALARFLIADPSWIRGVIARLPASVFAESARRTHLDAKVALAEASIADGAGETAAWQLLDAWRFVDGCHTSGAPGPDDWVVDCAAQEELRVLLEQVILKLLGGP